MALPLLRRLLRRRRRRKHTRTAVPAAEGPTLTAQLGAMLAGGHRYVHKDFPRLAQRVVVHDLRGGRPSPPPKRRRLRTPEGGAEHDAMERAQQDTSVAMHWVLRKLARTLEAEGDAHTHALASTAPPATLDCSELGVRALLEATVGHDSATGRVLKLVQQGVVMAAMFPVKTQLRCFAFSRDIRAPRGWRVRIEVRDASIAVTHVRRELLGNPAEPERQFECEWEVQAILNSAATEVLSSRVAIRQVYFDDDTILAEAKHAAMHELSHGSIIISC